MTIVNKPLIIAKVLILNDVYRPDYSGPGALEYCDEHHLYHLAAKKGEIMYCNVSYTIEKNAAYNCQTIITDRIKDASEEKEYYPSVYCVKDLKDVEKIKFGHVISDPFIRIEGSEYKILEIIIKD